MAKQRKFNNVNAYIKGIWSNMPLKIFLKRTEDLQSRLGKKCPQFHVNAEYVAKFNAP